MPNAFHGNCLGLDLDAPSSDPQLNATSNLMENIEGYGSMALPWVIGGVLLLGVGYFLVKSKKTKQGGGDSYVK